MRRRVSSLESDLDLEPTMASIEDMQAMQQQLYEMQQEIHRLRAVEATASTTRHSGGDFVAREL